MAVGTVRGASRVEQASLAAPDADQPVPLAPCHGGRAAQPRLPACAVRAFWSGYRGVTGEVPRARKDILRVLNGCPGAPEIAVCLSEIATNAVTHSRSGVPGGHFAVTVDLIHGQLVKVTVTDDGGSWAGRMPDPDISYGHGLEVVRDLSAGMAIEGDDARRMVWFISGWKPA